MLIGDTLSRLLLTRLVEDVFRTSGALALDAVIDFLARCGQQDDPRLTAALEQAMRRAWGALEAALAEELGWEHGQPGLAPRDAQTLRECLERVLAELAHGGPACDRPGAALVANALRRQCLSDVHNARHSGALTGCVDRQEWARSPEMFVRFAIEQSRPEKRRGTEGQLLRDLEQDGCVGLMRLLTAAAGLPLVLMAARAFLCQELTQLFYACLQENPEESPADCGLVLKTLRELSIPHFAVWRVPAEKSEIRNPKSERNRKEEKEKKKQAGQTVSDFRDFGFGFPSDFGFRISDLSLSSVRSRWMLGAVLSLVAVLLVVLPIWLIAEDARRRDAEQQRILAQRQRLRDERHRLEAQQQRFLDEQRRIALEEEIQQREQQRRQQVQERRRLADAADAKQRAEEEAEQRREAERQRKTEERRAQMHEQERRKDNARSVFADGLLHAACRRDQKALAALTVALTLDPGLDAAWKERGEVRRRLGDGDGALADFQQAVKRNPRDVHSLIRCGELHSQRHESARAIDAYTTVLRLQPRNVPAYVQRGLCYVRKNDLPKALADMTKAIELTPDDPLPYCYRANIHRLRSDQRRALDDYTAAINLDRTGDRRLAGAYRGRGLIALQLKRYSQAITDLTHALALDPNDKVARQARGQAYLENGDWNLALLDADVLLQHDDGGSEAYKLRGQAYLALEDYHKAHEDLTHALRGQRDAETYYLRARAKIHLGDFQEAIFDCNDATSINPHLACAFYLRGRLNLREGFPHSGREDLRTAHELDARFPALP